MRSCGRAPGLLATCYRPTLHRSSNNLLHTAGWPDFHKHQVDPTSPYQNYLCSSWQQWRAGGSPGRIDLLAPNVPILSTPDIDLNKLLFSEYPSNKAFEYNSAIEFPTLSAARCVAASAEIH